MTKLNAVRGVGGDGAFATYAGNMDLGITSEPVVVATTSAALGGRESHP